MITWNIRKGLGPHHGPRVGAEAIAAMLARRSPELVLLQEVTRRHGVAQGEDIARHVGMTSHYGANAFYRKGDHGNATLLRGVAREVENHDVSQYWLERRGVLRMVVEVDGHRIHVLNTHLSLTAGQRHRQIVTIARVLDATCERHDSVLLAGDFNDWSGRLDDRVRSLCGLEGGQAVAVREGLLTWPSFRPTVALDRVYFRGLRLRSLRALSDPEWRGLSDHLPLEADFDVP